MKKLLVLLLIIGMASAANAALSIDGPTEVNKDEPVIIAVVSDSSEDQIAYLSFGYVSEGGFELSDPRSPFPGPIIPYPSDDTIEFELIFVQPPNPIPPGNWFEVDLTCLKAGVDVFVHLIHSDTTTLLDTLTIHQIPEPMTLALLGLGGLFVLRRRK
ncbi:MAG: PEP-CTERM sorting domain-containing protein [Planctomycetota bacterium]|jgi:hypothetical protein